MENPQFSASEELEEYLVEPINLEDGLESAFPETKLIPKSSQEKPELTGWRAIQKTRKGRRYEPKISPPSHPDNSCIHHWRIDEPDGPTSEAVCRKCGDHTAFKNSSSESDKTTSSERFL